MDISAEKFTIVMTNQELWDTAWDVKRAFQNTIETHWINHQNQWKESESPRLRRIQSMFTALGRPDIYEECLSYAEGVFKKFNEKRADK